MPTQQETDETYLGVALLHAKLSKGKRLKARKSAELKYYGYERP